MRGLFRRRGRRSDKRRRRLAGGTGDAYLRLIAGAFGQFKLGGDFLLISEGAGIDGPGAEAFADEVDPHLVVAALDGEADAGEGVVLGRLTDQGRFALTSFHFGEEGTKDPSGGDGERETEVDDAI